MHEDSAPRDGGSPEAGDGRRPPVSVLLYVHDGGEYLDAALRSILAQTHTDLELVVVDDGSTDSTPAVLAAAAARDPRVRVHRQAARGRERLHETFNACVAHARHELLAIANADDLWDPCKLERQVDAFVADPELDICFHDARFIDAEGRHRLAGFRAVASLNPVRRLHLPALFSGDPIPNPTAVFRRSILRTIGLQEVGWVHDHQFWLKAALAGCTVLGLPDRLLAYRVHEASHSTSTAGRARVLEEQRIMARAMRARYELEDVFPDLRTAADPASRVWAHVDLARHLFHGGLVDLAAVELDAALRVVPEHPVVLAELGVVFGALGRLADARAFFERAAALGSDAAAANLAALETGAELVAKGWEGDEPPIVARLQDPDGGARRAVVPQAASLAVVPVGASPAGLQAAFVAMRAGEGPPEPLVVLTVDTAATAAVAAAYEAAEAAWPDGRDPHVELLEARPGELESLVAAHALDRPVPVPVG